MAFACPKCSSKSTVTHSANGVRTRICQICTATFATVETLLASSTVLPARLSPALPDGFLQWEADLRAYQIANRNHKPKDWDAGQTRRVTAYLNSKVASASADPRALMPDPEIIAKVHGDDDGPPAHCDEDPNAE